MSASFDNGFNTAPYPGLRPFRRDETDIFFGREEHVDQLLAKLGHTRFVAVVGPSGCGKSSLMRAGVLPALDMGFLTSAGVHWRVAEMQPGDHPQRRLAEALLQETALAPERAEDADALAILHATLQRGSLGLVEVLRETPLPESTNLLLLVDQFEEIFRFRQHGDSDEAEAFVALLLASVEQRQVPVYVVITMRSDFLGDCALFHDLPEAINAGQFLTPRLTREQLQEAIVGPAEVFGSTIEPTLVNRLLNDAGSDPDHLPLVQHVLMRMWTRARASASPSTIDSQSGAPKDDIGAGGAHMMLTVADYEKVGGLTAALSNHADEAYLGLDPEQQRITERLFRCLSERSAERRDIRRPVPLKTVAAVAGVSPEQVAETVEAFRQHDRSFLTPSVGNPLHPDTVLDISHESLIRQWPKLNQWVEKEVTSAETYHHLEQTARLHTDGRVDLLDRLALANTLDWKEREKPTSAWASRYGTDFDMTMAFLEASKRKRAKRKLVWFVGTALAVMAVLAVGWWRVRAIHQEKVNQEVNQEVNKAKNELARKEMDRLNEEKHRSIAQALAAQAIHTPDELGALLARQAYEFSQKSNQKEPPLPQIDDALRTTLGAPFLVIPFKLIPLQRHLQRHALQHNELWALQTLMPLVTGP